MQDRLFRNIISNRIKLLFSNRLTWVGFAIVVFHVWTLLHMPVHVDEAWLANRAWGFIQNGIVFGTLDSDLLTQYPGYERMFPLLGAVIQGFALKFVSAPSLMALRLVSLTFGYFLLISIYYLSRWFGNQAQALIAVLLVATSFPFTYSASMARTDIMTAALGYGALAFALNSHKHPVTFNLIAGLLAGIGLEIHPNGVLFIPLLLIIPLFASHKMVLLKQLFGMFTGLSFGLLIFFFIHLYPDPMLYFSINSLFFGPSHNPPLLTGQPTIWLESLNNHFHNIFNIITFSLILFPVAALFAVKSKNQKDWILLGGCIVIIIEIALLNISAHYYYNILIVPIWYILVAKMVYRLPWKKTVRPLIGFTFSSFIVGFIFLGILGPNLYLRGNFIAVFEKNQTHIARFVKPSDKIMASQSYWFGLYKHKYDTWEELVYYQHLNPPENLTDALLYYKPDIFILDAQTDSFINENPSVDTLHQYLWISSSDLERILTEYGELVETFDGGPYGIIRIYRLNY